MGGSSSLPLLGCGGYRVGCADLMLADQPDGDNGVFLRVFYPVDPDNTHISDSDRPVWLPRKEYLHGLASYLKSSPRKMQLMTDWVVGEKRAPALWERPLAGSQSTMHTSQSDQHLSSPSPSSSSSLAGSSSAQHLPNTAPTEFPVVVYSHGLAGCRHFYSTFCASVASYGYVVAAIEHRDRSAAWTYRLQPDGRTEKPVEMRLLQPADNEYDLRNKQLHKRVAEAVRTLHVLEEMNLGQIGGPDDKRILTGEHFNWKQFKGRLRISAASIMGHSFGGATALAACAFSTDFQAAVVFDGWMMPMDKEMFERCQVPTLFLNAGRFQWKENVARMERVDGGGRREIVTFRDAVHQSFSDFAFLTRPIIGKRMGMQGETDPIRTGDAAIEMTIAFLRSASASHAPSTEEDLVEKYGDFAMRGTDLDTSGCVF